ncbi:uncharacterized protein LOC135680981 [Rhopilema esculentum]|uniref:uncharacterized protein LOC135680981 n=1 Tax=Rhopilema esculentum TaxID=499914 RepID=UPI0031CEC264
MKKTKILTMQLQAEELNILDAMKLIEATVENLKKIRIDNKAMDEELDALNECAKQHGIDSAAEFSGNIDSGFHIEAGAILCELDVFKSMIEQQQIQPTSVKEAAKFSYENRRLFPTVYKCYSLLLTAPVSVAKDERTFSKLKIVKNLLRSRMKDERLNDLILLACEKDLTDTIPLDKVLKVWHEKNEKNFN